jgi:tetratricopeptide (TPR) repeat protein
LPEFRLNEDSSTLCFDQCFCIWYHDINLNEDVQSEMHNHLKALFTHFRIFNKLKEFTAYLACSLTVKKIFFIITSKNAQHIRTIAKNRLQYEKDYQFQPASSLVNHHLGFTDINELFIQISEDIRACSNQNRSSSAVNSTSASYRESRLPPPWSVWNSKITQNSFKYWGKESPEFFLFQALCRFLINMKCERNQSFLDMIGECRLRYINDPIEWEKIDDLAKYYKANDAILHYTKDSFLFRLLGEAFRSEDFERIFVFRSYIIDLHWELDKLFKTTETKHNVLRLYRGKKLCTTVIQQLQDNITALISMNGFLSTTYNREIAQQIFAGAGQDRPDYESVLFEFCIDVTTTTRTYANISSASQYSSEEEVLFTIGSVWKIDSVQKTDDLWTVKLLSCNDVDLRIIQFFEELPDDSTLLMIGDALLELGQYPKAENFYYKMLDESSIDKETRVTLYTKIAMIDMEQGRYRAALENFSKAEELFFTKMINTEALILQPLHSHSTRVSQIHLFNNMGISYQKIGKTDDALEYLMKALNVKNEIEPILKAKVHDNAGLIFFSHGQYGKASKHFSEAVQLAQDHSSVCEYKQNYEAANRRLHSRNACLDKELHKSN